MVALHDFSLALLMGKLRQTGSGDRFFVPFSMKISRKSSMLSSIHTNHLKYTV
jgi:hypothetical protein